MQFSQCPKIIGRIVDDIFALEDIFFLLKNEGSFFITFAFLFAHPNSDIFRRKAIKRIETYVEIFYQGELNPICQFITKLYDTNVE